MLVMVRGLTRSFRAALASVYPWASSVSSARSRGASRIWRRSCSLGSRPAAQCFSNMATSAATTGDWATSRYPRLKSSGATGNRAIFRSTTNSFIGTVGASR
jgi:hypothetical protein